VKCTFRPISYESKVLTQESNWQSGTRGKLRPFASNNREPLPDRHQGDHLPKDSQIMPLKPSHTMWHQYVTKTH